jgi:dolichol-phosphate mannosyltransferase
MKKTPFAHLSIVSPVYLAENMLDELVGRLMRVISTITENFELILVDDGSPDKSWEKIEALGKANPRIKGIRLSRNFGQHSAIAAGVEAAQGEWTVVMDCDLQDRPEEIPILYHKAQEGYDIVLAKKNNKYSSKSSLLFSKLFYRTISWVSGMNHDHSLGNFGIYHTNVIASLLQVQSSIRYFPSMVNWVGFKKTHVLIEQAERSQGKSSYNFRKKCSLALNVMLAYTDRPLKFVIGFGLLISSLAFLFALVVIYKAWQGKIVVLGYASLIISISFFSGVIICILGIIGSYIGKIFESIKVKPAYLIAKKINDSSQ